MSESVEGRPGEDLRPGEGKNDRPPDMPGRDAPRDDDDRSREAASDVGDARDTRTGD